MKSILLKKIIMEKVNIEDCSQEQIRYFYDEKQNFIYRMDFSDGYCKSLLDMIEKYKLWSNSNDIWKERV